MGYPFPGWAPGIGEHKFIWVKNGDDHILPHAFREYRSEWSNVAWADHQFGMTPTQALYSLGLKARKATLGERFRYWLYTKGWRDEPV